MKLKINKKLEVELIYFRFIQLFSKKWIFSLTQIYHKIIININKKTVTNINLVKVHEDKKSAKKEIGIILIK